MSLNISEASQTRDSAELSEFQFPVITFPPENRRITSFAELETYFKKGPTDLYEAFKSTYGLTDDLEHSSSLLQFLEKWGKTMHAISRYVLKEFPPEFFTKLLKILNIETNVMGCTFLASLYPCFRENYLSKRDTPIAEKEVVRDFMYNILWHSRELFFALLRRGEF